MQKKEAPWKKYHKTNTRAMSTDTASRMSRLEQSWQAMADERNRADFWNAKDSRLLGGCEPVGLREGYHVARCILHDLGFPDNGYRPPEPEEPKTICVACDRDISGEEH